MALEGGMGQIESLASQFPTRQLMFHVALEGVYMKLRRNF